MMATPFQLKFHIETKKEAVYALAVDKTGPKLISHTSGEPRFRSLYGSLTVRKGDMASLADWLSRELWRVVIDKTGLKGDYDYKLEWTPEPGEGGPESMGLPSQARAPVPQTSGPTIFTALKEQLGLRLVPQKGPVQIIVIDGVDKPTIN